MSSYLASFFIQSAATNFTSLFSYWSGGIEKPLDISKVGINPMTGMAQLALLYYHQEGTKFDFEGHQIVFYEPTSGQGASRAISGSSRDIILKLEPLISTALCWYQPREHVEIQKIFLRTIRGLKILKRTYKSSDMVKSHIDTYIEKIANACIIGIPKKEPANAFQQEIYEMGLKEVEDLTRLLNEFPGGDLVTYEPEQKYESDSPQESQAQILNQSSSTSSSQNSSLSTTQNSPTSTNLSNSSSSTNSVSSSINQDNATTNEESGAEGSPADIGIYKTEDEAKHAKEINTSQSKQASTGTKGRKYQNKSAAAPTATPTANPKQNQAPAASADSSSVKTPSIASTPQPVEATPTPFSELSTVVLDATAAKRKTSSELSAVALDVSNTKRKSSTELVDTALGTAIIAKQKLYEAAVKKLKDEEVMPHPVEPVKFSNITTYLKGEADTFSKKAKQAVVDILLFK